MATSEGPRDDLPESDAGEPAAHAPDTRPTAPQVEIERTRAAVTWTGLVIGVLVLVLLLVFILQNLDRVTLKVFLWDFSVPLGIVVLLAAIAGALVMALAGGVRILQIRRVARKARAGQP
ncbi:DUF1049 domain-containing protein [Rhodococcus spelaei]|uniref:DUF1049 domain-containing protein n=1 Tax=Rhodococcus spelaei TaxID=2546320 RepID=A0A541B453_9NOCA|nr:lipopolysaccharide assembly protein LapA domain-containing protein [Rhodococcus spelaei]TQF67080.1 DUF1049 domain-containing protein [Rhodococcus spelaei]